MQIISFKDPWSVQTLIQAYLRQTPRSLSAASFISMFAWQDFFEFDGRVIDGCLCVFARSEVGCFLYLPPLGRNVSRRAITACFDMMEDANQGGGVTRIENVSEAELECFPETEFRHTRQGYEYCYDRASLAGLKGGLYKSKRASYNQFAKTTGHRFLPYEDGMLEECLELYDRWARERTRKCAEDIYRHMIDENRVVHERVLRDHARLNAVGRVVTVNGKIKAYTLGYPLNDHVFCVFLEVTDFDMPGLAVYIFSEFCRDPGLAGYRVINAMDDFEMPNVQKTKMSFRPSALLASYAVRRREGSKRGEMQF